MFYDIEAGELVTLEQLRAEYEANRAAQPEEYNYSFADYVVNSLTSHNGTLERI